MRPKLRHAAALAAVTLLSPSEHAEACGGTFCDTGPQAMPVDQSGENILFVMHGDQVEAHVQIQYQGAAERFAWVVPMPEVPEVSIGSQLLFSSLLNATVPSYGFTSRFESCDVGGGGIGGAGGSWGSGGSGGTGGGAGGPHVVFTKTVGAFEVTVLQGGTALEVSQWLTDNAYQTVGTAPAILGRYVQRQHVFVAIKLTAGADVREIHPLVFRYPGNRPCVPLELTAVAAVEDMPVRAFFLGDDRVYPSNYRHVEVNPVRLDWSRQGANYTTLVSRAVDSAVANGHAFVTEYAGSAAILDNAGFFSNAWNAAAFASARPETVIDLLNAQGLASCYSWTCSFQHPLVLPLLQKYLPAPGDVLEPEFYGDLARFVARIDPTRWSGPGFAQEMEERIVAPGRSARRAVDRYRYLTRLFTTISPREMTVDPEFHARAELTTDVDRRRVFASQVTDCCGGIRMELPGGRVVHQGGGLWPAFSSLMPWAERIEEVPPTGGSIVLVDNVARIDAALAAHNARYSVCNDGGGGGASGSGAGGSGASAAGGSGGGGAGTGGGSVIGGAAGTSAGDAPGSDLETGGGGGCTMAVRAGSGFAALGVLALAVGARRARRGRDRSSPRGAAKTARGGVRS